MNCIDEIRKAFCGLLLGALSVPLVSMAAQSGKTNAAQPVWPPPPEQARFAYVQSISKPEDAGVKASGMRRLSNWVSGANQGNEPLNNPFGLSVDDAGNLCLTDTGVNAVFFCDTAAKRWLRWEKIGGIRFESPVAVGKKGRTLFVADSAFSGIVAFDLDGKLLFQIKEELVRPSGLAISGNQLLVADTGAHCVVRFDLKGKFLGRFGTRGEGNGEFNYPTHVAADSNGNIYVTDAINNRVQVFDGNGNFQRQIGRAGDGPGSFSRPKGIAVDPDGHAYIVDAVFNNIQLFDSEGRLLMDIGSPGDGAGEFCLPNGIAVGRDNRIYVADTFNRRVQVFEPVGQK